MSKLDGEYLGFAADNRCSCRGQRENCIFLLELCIFPLLYGYKLQFGRHFPTKMSVMRIYVQSNSPLVHCFPSLTDQLSNNSIEYGSPLLFPLFLHDKETVFVLFNVQISLKAYDHVLLFYIIYSK
jgi:hypothetical protein